MINNQFENLSVSRYNSEIFPLTLLGVPFNVRSSAALLLLDCSNVCLELLDLMELYVSS